jgi:hypothetical protein
LSAGTYYVEIEDAKGCRTLAATPEIVQSLPIKIIFEVDHHDANFSQNNGELWLSSIDASPGNGALYTWSWRYTTDQTWNTNVSRWYGISTIATNLLAGTYYVEIKDAQGCKSDAIETINTITDVF